MKKISESKYLELLDKYWRAANYLSVAQLYLLDNPLLNSHELNKNDIKKKLTGHWGTVPGQNFVYAHVNRIVKKYNQKAIYISGPGHGGNYLTANDYLDGTLSEFYPEISEDEEGIKKLCKRFSFPYGIGSHAVPETPGSIHEGGELGYSLSHAYGAVLDNPELIAVAVVGDGEAETGPLSTSWFCNKFINPKTDGFVLPVLHLNGYKISNPTVLSRLSRTELTEYFSSHGYKPYFVEGNDSKILHKIMAKAMDNCMRDFASLRNGKKIKFPMIVLRTPKGWTCPKIVKEKEIEGSFNAHQVPFTIENEEDIKLLETWLKSYKPEELFNENCKLKQEIKHILPLGDMRLGASKFANGGLLLKELKTPDINKYAVKFTGHGTTKAQDMMVLGEYIRDLFVLNKKNKNYRIFSPDEALSNRLNKVFEVENRAFGGEILSTDEFLSNSGRVHDSYLSEHVCEGMLEGYLLTGRHGMFDSYEAFIRVVDSMISQHAKWLKCTREIPWRAPISSLNLILTSNTWQQDHNGYTHQEPGFLNHLFTKKPEIVRAYLPADANTLLCSYDHVVKTKNEINTIIASKHPRYQWLNMKEAKEHFKKGVSIWKWASLNDYDNPDVVIASAGDTATIESLATVSLIKKLLPKLNVKFINVVDLAKLLPKEKHPHGLTDKQFDELLTTNKPIIFNFHGYPELIEQFVFKRKNRNIVVSGYTEEGNITTAFDLCMRNKTDRYNQLINVVNNIKISEAKRKEIISYANKMLKDNIKHVKETGVDLDEIANWNWND